MPLPVILMIGVPAAAVAGTIVLRHRHRIRHREERRRARRERNRELQREWDATMVPIRRDPPPDRIDGTWSDFEAESPAGSEIAADQGSRGPGPMQSDRKPL